MSLLSIALTIFLVANPIGNIPGIIALLKDFSFERQKKILLREGLFSYFIAIAFLFIGEQFLEIIQIKEYSVSVSGGVLLVIVSLEMIFPPPPPKGADHLPQEPFIVPIATPLITGGGVLSTILIYAAKVQNYPKIALAITIAWVFVIAIVVGSAYLLKVLGKRGLLALEQLMGMVLLLIAVEILSSGIRLFIKALSV